ncbi:MAG: lactate racemase domain-containing protein [Bradymonadaceae bacterium]
MSRPSTTSPHVRILDEDSPPRALHYGEDFLLEPFPAGTRAIYPKPPMEGVPNRGAAIRYALNNPEGDSPPLYARLEPGMKVTIAIDDISVPLPPMKRPDVRQSILEILVETLEKHGVEDFEMPIALALHRPMTDDEIERMVGPELFDRFYPEQLYNMDAEAPDEMVVLGETSQGEEVQILRRAAESDLLIYVNVNFVPMNGGYKSIGTGLSGYQGIRHHHNPDTILESDSYMDPDESALYDSNRRMGELIKEHVDVFHVETSLNNKMYDDQLSFLARPEEEWSSTDWMKFKSMRWSLDKMPRKAKRKIFHSMPADYSVTGVHAGDTQAAHEKTLQKGWQQHCVEVDGQSDVVVYGIPFESPYNVNSIMNPLLVRVMALGYYFNSYRNKPLIREDGTLIVTHPCYDEFDADYHPSYIEFFNRCLPQTRDSAELAHRWEEEFANNPNYVEMYRRGNAYHGVHPFYMWYWAENGADHVGQVIVVGPENDHVPERLGWQSADTMQEALRMARDIHGDPDISLLQHPPHVMTDVQ